ncbi:MAG: hypothetical protein ACUVX8_10315 [Candidatus Zipacnadales bacterium]
MALVTPSDLVARALALRRYQRIVRMFVGVLAMVLVAALGQVGLLFLSTIDLPLLARLAFLGCVLMACASLAIWTVWLVVTTPPPQDVAVLVERRFPELRDRFVTAVEIGLTQLASRSSWTAASTTSPVLAQKLAVDTEIAIRGHDLRDAIDTQPLRWFAGIASALVCGLAISAVLFPDTWTNVLKDHQQPSLALSPEGEEMLPVGALTGPAIANVTLTLDYPAYTKRLPETRDSDLENVSALAGTRVTIAGTIAGKGVTAKWRLNQSERPLTIGPDRRVIARFTVTSDATWQLCAEDVTGRLVSTPVFRIHMVPDQPPKIVLLEPGRNIAIPELRPMRLAYRAEDDWGLGRIVLEYRTPEHTAWTSVPLESGGGRRLLGAWNWDLHPLRLMRGQTVSYRLIGYDNNVLTGPQITRTPTYTVAIEDQSQRDEATLFRSPEPEQRESESLEQLKQEVEKLGQQIKELISGLDEGEMTATERSQRVVELHETQRRVAEQADRVSRMLTEAERRAEQQGISAELQEQLRELHDLLQKTMNEDLAKALKEIDRALASMKAEELERGLQQAQESQQKFAEQLEQVVALLRRARLERDVFRVAQQARKLAEEQERLNVQRQQLAEQRAAPDARQQAKRQEELAEREADLETDLHDLAQKAEKLNRQLADQLSQSQEQLQNLDTQNAMREAMLQLQQGNLVAAASLQQRALNALQQAASRLSQLPGLLSSSRQDRLPRIVQELLRDTLYLSRRQEQVMRATEDIQPLHPGTASGGKGRRESVRRDQESLEVGVRELAERLQLLAEETPLVNPSLSRQAQHTADLMAQAGREAAGGGAPQAMVTQRQAMRGLNDLAKALIATGEQIQQASAATTLQQAMQQLQALTQQQGNLNQQTQQAKSAGRQPQKEGGSGNLADQQANIRKALERLLQKAGQPTGLSDRLADLPTKMEDVEQELRADRLSNETLTRQQEILHRMLDAQRSVYKKDQERRQRIAERPKPFRLPPSPPELTPRPPPQRAPGEVPNEEGELPLDFEDIVRQYFRALAELP